MSWRERDTYCTEEGKAIGQGGGSVGPVAPRIGTRQPGTLVTQGRWTIGPAPEGHPRCLYSGRMEGRMGKEK